MRLNRMIFHFLKYPIETDNKVGAICDQANANKAYEGKLLVTDTVTQTTLKSGYVIMRAREVIVPRRGGRRGARNQRSKEVVETKRQCGGPCADEENFGQRMSQFG
jgi:hypothetical protein